MRALFVLIVFIIGLISTPVAAQDARGCDDGGLTDVNHASTGIPLLGRFAFEYTSKDHHITQILIAPDFTTGVMRLGYHDKNSDDDYCYNITHFNVTDSRAQRFTRGLDICSDSPGKCTVRLERPAGDFVFVLIGFQLSFTGNRDKHIDEVAVLEDDGLLTVAFNDGEHGIDDNFEWSIQYAYVPSARFREVGVLTGTRARGDVALTMPGGAAVLRGFRFDFKQYFTSGRDHHIRKIGILPVQSSPLGHVSIFYHDKNSDDGFDWEYRYGILGRRLPAQDFWLGVHVARDPG